MKRLFAILICFSILFCFSGCGLDKQLNTENFYCYIIDENNIAIGDVCTYPESGAVFFPEKIENYTVSKIGFSSGLGFGGNGYFTSISSEGPNIKRCYFPHTIKEVRGGYMSLTVAPKIFYCGEVIDVVAFDDDRLGSTEVYVPAEKYELFKDVLSEYYRGSLLKANLSYLLNYDENNYYYVDYYENGEKIIYIPPIPERDGYIFDGWYKEIDCTNKWDFDNDVLQLTDEEQEIKLYAKWITKQ